MPRDALAPIDPFAADDVLSMTHQPEAVNPVPGIVKPAADFLTSGDMAPVHLPGTEPKDYLRELQNTDIMGKNIEQASNFAGMAGAIRGRPIGSFTNTLRTNTELATKARDMLAAGKTQQEISGELGISREAIKHYIMSEGLQGEYGKVGDLRSNQSNIDTIQEMLNNRRSFRDIGEHFGMSRDAIAGIVKRMGLKGRAGEGDLSLPSFEFMKKSVVAEDKDYVNALNKYIEENGYGVKVEQVDHDPFEPLK